MTDVIPFKKAGEADGDGGTQPFDVDQFVREITRNNTPAQRYWLKLQVLDHVAGLIQRARTEAGMTQPELAEATGIAQPAISRLEKSPLDRKGPLTERLDGPCIGRLAVILDACGFDLRLELVKRAKQ